jgi:type IV secretion system protein TrbJ
VLNCWDAIWCRKSCRRLIGVVVSVLSIFTTTCSSADGLVVFDPLNYNQSILSAVRSLQQINIQIMSLTKQTQMLINSTKNITSAPGNIATQLRANVDEITRLMSQASGLTFKVSITANQFQSAYPLQYPSGTSVDRLGQDANSRRNNTYAALNQALLVQSQSVEALNSDGGGLSTVMGRSSTAIGGLQAQQASNELLGLQVKQNMQTQALMATEARASVLRDAQQLASEAESVERFKQFIGNGQAYVGGR